MKELGIRNNIKKYSYEKFLLDNLISMQSSVSLVTENNFLC